MIENLRNTTVGFKLFFLFLCVGFCSLMHDILVLNKQVTSLDVEEVQVNAHGWNSVQISSLAICMIHII